MKGQTEKARRMESSQTSGRVAQAGVSICVIGRAGDRSRGAGGRAYRGAADTVLWLMRKKLRIRLRAFSGGLMAPSRKKPSKKKSAAKKPAGKTPSKKQKKPPQKMPAGNRPAKKKPAGKTSAMTPESSDAALRRFLDKAGVELQSITPAAALDLMTHFYTSVPAKGCDRDDDGDMLLYQCGVYDRGKGSEFSVDFVRQFMKTDDDEDGDDAMSQLHITLYFDRTVARSSECEFNVWCADEDDLDDFRAAAVASTGFQLAAGVPPRRVELKLGGV